MADYRVSLNDLPPTGKEFVLDDPAIWGTPLAEFGMECRVTEPISARVQLLPVDNGILLRGSIKGGVALPCNRCAESAPVTFSADFEDFEELAGEEAADDFEAEPSRYAGKHAGKHDPKHDAKYAAKYAAKHAGKHDVKPDAKPDSKHAGKHEAANEFEHDVESRVMYEGHAPMLDLAAVCWEEFMLALPVNPLCTADCKGLCIQCGADLNKAACNCQTEDGDPRLAPLRKISVRKP